MEIESERDFQDVISKLDMVVERVSMMEVYSKDDEKVSKKLLEEAEYYVR